jgi:tetratricopeptide (TPR) repeat protein
MRARFVAAVLVLACAGCRPAPTGGPPSGPSPPANPTFASDVAPIIFQHCAGCHRPGESAPFPLLSYDDVRERSKQIAEVTAERVMPPWLPVEGYGRFVGERRLSAEAIAILQRWHEQGAVEGDRARTPPVPAFTPGWQLGEPDLVVTMPEPFVVPAEGTDVYRNFVLPLPIDRARFVRGVEFRPGNPRVVHHAFVLIDDRGDSVALDEADPGPGFGGMSPGQGARSPGGHFVSWQPGKSPSFVPEGMSWRLPMGSRLVLQVHMQTTGKPESVQASVGFFFTDQPPVAVPYKLVLASADIDIPPGETDYVLDSSYTLPVDVTVLGLIPHAHYLGKELHGWADLPDGSRKWLIRIDQWDFNWQGDYRLAEPLALPKGSVIHQHFTYDNSEANPRNPNQPPKRVAYGLNTSDEMGELWIQVLPKSHKDHEALNLDFGRHALDNRLDAIRRRLSTTPDDPEAHIELGKTLIALGRGVEAIAPLDRAIELDDRHAAEAYYLKGMQQIQSGGTTAAHAAFSAAVERNPRHFAAQNALGMLALRTNDNEQALRFFRLAVEAWPESAASQANLGLALLRLGRPREAIAPLEAARAIEPENPKRAEMLERARTAADRQ